MKLDDEEQAMRAGALGRVAQIAIEHQIKVGDFFGAADFVPVTQAHIMADTESLGESGVRWLEALADADDRGARVRIPTITDPRGTDFAKASDARSRRAWMLTLERRAIDAFVRLGVAMTDTCINYQTIQAPTRGEHLAFGDTGVVIYSNSICGARSNFEGGPSALSAGLTGRTPRYGFHLDAQRQATVRVRVDCDAAEPERMGRARRRDRAARRQLLGGAGGRRARRRARLRCDEAFRRGDGELRLDRAVPPRRHHARGDAPRGRRRRAPAGRPSHRRGRRAGAAAQSYATTDEVDVVVFSAPQLSLYELRRIAELCDGRRFVKPLLAVTSPQVKPDCDRFGYTERIEGAGGQVLSGMCFYQSYAREVAEANGWKRLATNSAKLVNILGGYGYVPMLASMEQCVEAAETGRLA